MSKYSQVGIVYISEGALRHNQVCIQLVIVPSPDLGVLLNVVGVSSQRQAFEYEIL